jgi:diguanylate cyclase
MDVALETADKLKTMGVSLAMDDFGTGYASLASLQALPFDKIKIDKSFLREMETHDQAGPILEAAISLGQRLGISVLVEGVETKAEVDFIQSVGCNLGQGFFYGRPLSSHAFETKSDALHLQGLESTRVKTRSFQSRGLKAIG